MIAKILVSENQPRFKYLTIDGMVSGTGIRDDKEYIDPESLRLSSKLVKRLKVWHESYQTEFYKGYENESLTRCLDREGIEISKAVTKEYKECKVEYLSDSTFKKTLVSR